jgi:crotonobetainyl-CoA:carnitine CoA-transferase CaiB-like acyl-CoA transferase
MTHQPMKGIRMVEVAQFTFTPSAGAVLADWGADVIKVEHAITGDAQRGLRLGTGSAAEGSFQPLMEHPNRGKRSIGLALETPGGRDALDAIVRQSDVFLTNFLPAARRRLRIEVDDIRAVNPDIIYVRGSAHGQRGPDAEKGGYDMSAYWGRAGSSVGATPSDSPRMIDQPAGAYGDSIGGMTIAGGISAALFARERTGEPSVVDVSLLGVGGWATALSVTIARLMGEPWPARPLDAPPHQPANPLTGFYRTADDRWICLTQLQPGRYWADTCRHLGLDHLVDDERFDTAEKIMQNAEEAGRYIKEAFAKKPYAEWLTILETMEGQWARTNNAFELADDPQMRANGYILPVTDVEGNERELVANPVQFDETPPTLTRAPQFAEHTDEILREVGISDEAALQLKIDGAAT